MRIASTVAVSLLAWGVAGHAWAGTTDLNELSCGDKAIQLGMSHQDIKTACGHDWEPVYISKHDRPALRPAENGEIQTDHYEQWLYKPSGMGDTYVLLKNGEVVRIFTVQQ